ncbi:phosphatidylglycerophosphatase A [Candidatus Purcelliella pentastirinorum]|nr:phosphatidylglycerophosphatase A [Candidatus Purcelliella pentastirinorum]WDR80638.1 phosphatidylglycerophosphatase A [Candidatus Purcelliella pentastirinorum]
MWLSLTIINDKSKIFIIIILFRTIDITKPWPIIKIHRHLSGGFGIMLDDIISSIITGMLISLIKN